MTLRGGSTLAIAGSAAAGLNVGRDAGANGALTITDGASIAVDSDRSLADFGRGAGSTGIVSVTAGGSLSVTGTSDGDIFIGAAFEDLGRAAGGFGSLLVSGEGSLVEALDRVIVRAPEEFGGGASTGILNVSDGGVLRAATVNLGTGGVLTGDGGKIDADLRVSGGVVAPGSSPGVMDILGDFSILGGTLQFEFAGVDPGQFDRLNILGDFLATDPFTVELAFLDGFLPEAGQTFDILSISGESGDLDALLAASLVTFDVTGPPPGFEFTFDLAGGTFEVLAVSVAQVPLPASAPLLLLAVAGLAWAGRRRASLRA